MIRIETTNDGTPQAVLIGARQEPERILLADLLAAYRTEQARQQRIDAGAPWLLQNSPTGQRRIIEQATYATERKEVAK